MLPAPASGATVFASDHDDRSGGATTYLMAAVKSVAFFDSGNVTYTLPAVSTAPGESSMPTTWPVDPRSTASDCVHEPRLPSVDVATQTRVALTTFTSNGPG